MMTVDGMNEEGLAGHILWLTESTYGTYDNSKPGLSMAVWMQYFLDNFATVDEAVSWIDRTGVQVVPLGDPATGEVPAVHLALDDATGDSAVIEYLDGKAVIWHSRDHVVMTNSPTYDKQIDLLRQIEGFGGDKPIPGTDSASDRFARAAHYVGRLPDPENPVEAVAGILSVMRNAAQPFRTPAPGKPYVSQTIWQTVADLTNKRYVFESTTRPNIVWSIWTISTSARVRGRASWIFSATPHYKVALPVRCRATSRRATRCSSSHSRPEPPLRTPPARSVGVEPIFRRIGGRVGRWGRAAVVAVASFCGPAPAPGVDDTTEAPASTTRTPRIVDDSAAPTSPSATTSAHMYSRPISVSSSSIAPITRTIRARSRKVRGGRDWTISSRQSNRYSTLE